METNLMPMLTDVGFPIGLCLILLYGFKKVGEVLLARVVDPVAPRTESSSRSLSNSLSKPQQLSVATQKRLEKQHLLIIQD